MESKTYTITETERLNIIAGLDRLAGSRGLANFFEFELPKKNQPEKVANPIPLKK